MMFRKFAIFIAFLVGPMSWGLGGCSTGNSTLEAPALDRYLHVALDGWAESDGSMETPLYYINGAMQKAFQDGYRGIKIATGEYTAYLVNADLRFYGGIDIIGGCDRQTWEPVAGQYSKIYALHTPIKAVGVRTPTLVQGLEIVGTQPGWSSPTSCAVYLDGCGPELRFERCRFVSRNGYEVIEPPQDGHEPGPGWAAEAGGQGVCDAAEVVPGGRGGTSSCSGGDGGPGGLPNEAGADGGPSCQFLNDYGGAGGGVGQDGQDGIDGADGADGPNGVATPGLGRLTSGTIVPDRQGKGERGQSGEGGGGGGGGGGSVRGTGNGGGGGGSGGQGAYLPPRGGQGGGHAIAVISVNSDAVFRQCAFISGDGGQGGPGGSGTPGALGMPGAPGGDACPGEAGRGGHGGHGGDGGASGGAAGGNGGSSFGLLVFGPLLPDLGEDCEISAGVPGQPGAGGRHGNGLTLAPSGFAGESAGLKIITPDARGLSHD